MTAAMLAAEAKWLPQFRGRKLRPTPAIAIPKGLRRVDVPLDPALAIANRFQILAEQKTTRAKKAKKARKAGKSGRCGKR